MRAVLNGPRKAVHPRLTRILCAVTVTFAAFSTCRLLEARPVADAERENWGETVDGLQSRLTAPKNLYATLPCATCPTYPIGCSRKPPKK